MDGVCSTFWGQEESIQTWENNIKMDLTESACEDVGCIQLLTVILKPDFCDQVHSPQGFIKQIISVSSEQVSTSEGRSCSMEFF
jgi:hypothetical protein